MSANGTDPQLPAVGALPQVNLTATGISVRCTRVGRAFLRDASRSWGTAAPAEGLHGVSDATRSAVKTTSSGQRLISRLWYVPSPNQLLRGS